MASYIVTVSPKGQITIPVKERENLKYPKLLMEVKNKTITLKPIEIKVIEADDMQDFSALAELSFDFWNNPQDDIYQKFYAN